MGPPLAMPLIQGTQIIFKILEVYLRDYARQLEYSKQYLLQVRCYFSSLSTSTHEANLLEVVTKNNLQSSAHGLLFILHTLSDPINFSKCTIGVKNSLDKSIQSYTKYHME